MTQPDAPEGAESGVKLQGMPLQLQLQVDGGAVPGPDGKPWVVVAVAWGFSNFQLLVPENVAEQALQGEMFGQALAKGIQLAKVARGAAVQLATQQDLAKLLGPNGQPVR